MYDHGVGRTFDDQKQAWPAWEMMTSVEAHAVPFKVEEAWRDVIWHNDVIIQKEKEMVEEKIELDGH